MTKPPALFTIPAGTRGHACSQCRATIYFAASRAGGPMQPLAVADPMEYRGQSVATGAIVPSATTDGKGYNHRIDCPGSANVPSRTKRSVRGPEVPDGYHECPAKECQRTVPDSYLACNRHWSMVPKDLQGKVYAAYRRRNASATAKAEHLRLCALAIRAMNGESVSGEIDPQASLL